MRPRWDGLLLAGVLLTTLLGAGGAAAQEESLPDWIPSVGFGPGIYSRASEGTVDGLMKTDAVGPVGPTIPCDPQGFCLFYDQDERDIDGPAAGINAQLIGPPAASWPLRPRPFVQGAWVRTFYSRVLAERGFQPEDFDANLIEPDVQLELNADPQYLWYAGGGVALQLPIERPTFIKLGAHYMEERLDMLGRVQRFIGDVTPLPEGRKKEELDVRSLGPDFGVEVEVLRFGPIASTISADVLLSFPLTSLNKSFEVEEPLTPAEAGLEVDPAVFSYDADNVHILGALFIRFAWVGR